MLDSTAAVAAERQGKNARQLLESQRFLDELLGGVPIQPVTVPVALRAGQIDGHSQASGIRIPLSDLPIGAGALELGYGVGTANVRHFEQIPGLKVVKL